MVKENAYYAKGKKEKKKREKEKEREREKQKRKRMHCDKQDCGKQDFSKHVQIYTTSNKTLFGNLI